MTDPNVEIEAARLLLEQDECATASPVADAAVRAAMEQMSQTAAALRAWRQGHESMPAPVIVPVASISIETVLQFPEDDASVEISSRNFNDADQQADAVTLGLPVGAVGLSRRRTAGIQRSPGEINTGKNRFSRRWQFIGAAAAAIIVVGVAIFVLSRESWGDSNKLAVDRAWAGKTAPVAPADQSARMEFDTQSKGFGGKAGVPGAPGNLDAAPGSLGGVPVPGGARGGPPGDSQPPELDAFIRQFTFAFRIPQQLPGGWEFERGRPISESRVQLIYRCRDQSFSVFESPAGGGDLEFRGVDIGGRKMFAGRRGGLAIAFEGGQADPKIWNAIVGELAATKGKTP